MRRLLTSRLRAPLALIAGLLMPLGFAPFGIGMACVLGLAVIFAIVAADWRRVPKLAAYLFGVGYAGFGVYWIFISISRYGGGPLAASLVTPFLILLFALYPLFALWLGAALARRREAVTCLIALPAAWVAVEWVRSWLFTGATWLSVGYSQIDTPLAALAPIFGTFGLTAVAALAAGLMAWWLLRPVSLRALALPAAALLYALPMLLAGVDTTAPAGEPLDVALVQGNVPQERKWQADARLSTMRDYMETTRELFGTPLVVWPETAVPAFYHQVRDDWLRPFAARAQAARTAVVTGVPAVDLARRAAFNAVTVLGSGEFYYKRHLVPFGEYVPFRDWFGGALDFIGAPLGDFNAGTNATVLDAAGVRLGISICYEVTFGAEVAEALPAAELLINVSNDAWFGDSLAPYQHLEMARMRSLETGRYMVRATNTGISAMIDDTGHVFRRSPMFEEAMLKGTVQPRRGATWYVYWRDWPVVGMAFAGLLVAVGAGRTRRRADA